MGQHGRSDTAALLGLTDVDALTMSMARRVSETVTLELGARGIAIGVAANTALKLALALALSTGFFRKVAGGTLAVMLCTSLAWLLL